MTDVNEDNREIARLDKIYKEAKQACTEAEEKFSSGEISDAEFKSICKRNTEAAKKLSDYERDYFDTSESHLEKTMCASDFLNCDEVEFTKKCACTLKREKSWRDFLNDEKIQKAINITTDTEKSEANVGAMKSAMFEIRIAYLIHQSGLSAKYEANAHQKNKKTIDFSVHVKKSENINLLIEVSSLRKSKLEKEKSWENEEFFGCCLNGDDEVSGYFKAQKVLVEKAEKFPSKIAQDQFHIIILDMRSSILGSTDCWDYHSILFGSEGLDAGLQRATKRNELFPGILSQDHPGSNCNNVKHLRKSIHYFGFVIENNYKPDELATKIKWFKNPNLINESNNLNLRMILNGKNA